MRTALRHGVAGLLLAATAAPAFAGDFSLGATASTLGFGLDNLTLTGSANLDGGGNTDENRRAKSPLPASRLQKEGNQLESAQQRVRVRAVVRAS